jgi:hypothetical protein
MTLKELKAEQRRNHRRDLREIEKILHPCPVINGVEILHEHKRGTGQIEFVGYTEKDGVLGCRYIDYDPGYIQAGDKFYEDEADNMYWLATGELNKKEAQG